MGWIGLRIGDLIWCHCGKRVALIAWNIQTDMYTLACGHIVIGLVAAHCRKNKPRDVKILERNETGKLWLRLSDGVPRQPVKGIVLPLGSAWNGLALTSPTGGSFTSCGLSSSCTVLSRPNTLFTAFVFPTSGDKVSPKVNGRSSINNASRSKKSSTPSHPSTIASRNKGLRCIFNDNASL